MVVGLAILISIVVIAVGIIVGGIITDWGKANITNDDIKDFVFFNAFVNQIHNHYDSNNDKHSIF